MKLFTPVSPERSCVSISLSDRVMLLGSCFSDEIASRMHQAGFSICANPFGKLYNPASLSDAVERLQSGRKFTEDDCVTMGAGSGLVCSFRHHTSFARPDAGSFLENANARLEEACGFWHDCNKVIVTLGTAFVWDHRERGIVSNCLKRDASEFRHYMLSVEQCAALLEKIKVNAPGKQFIFTVSPIRHMSMGAHQNTLSKSTLHLAVDRMLQDGTVSYFPACEILCDELRDYRFYAEDLVHPSKMAADIIWERFKESAVPKEELVTVAENEKAAKRGMHRSLIP